MAEASGFQVDLQHLDDVTARIRGFKQFVSDHLTELDNKAKAVGALWSGQAGVAYAQAHRDWADGAMDVREGLEVLEAAARAAHGNYTGAVAANMRMFGQ